MLKTIILISFFLNKGFDAVIRYLNDKHQKGELPENVRDVYDEKEYANWKNYKAESGKLYTVWNIADIVFLAILLISNAYAWGFKVLEGCNVYVQYLIFIFVLTVLSELIDMPFKYYDTFVIEEKYGLNKSTKKTFFADIIKNILVGGIMSFLIIALTMFIFEAFGNMAILVGTVAMMVIMLVLNLIIVPLMRIYNKFTPLEDGELKSKLLTLCEKYGMRVRKIVVRDASRRTTTSNAFCAGFGKLKTISLDDNLVNNFTDDEIVAVFAHEFAHAKYKHTVKSLPFSMVRILLVFIALWIVLNIPGFYTAFGFDGINYFFAEILVTFITWPVSNGLNIISNYLSRRHEYQADAFAAKEGYGHDLVSSLKRLHKEALSDINPHPVKVVLDYSHPTLSQRITAIEGVQTGRG
ncbi:M48 family metallopeptidase [Butyrivibrio sp. M55]|uniref:M48 family metallopeptidase n=1 Tax=Butyrivibrio sp. M55 TaxID=1855323 RepID=UPI0008E52E26|nr:M48 family metallopeptidase [Butyrivibrio sp. M55]SFU71702.1 STE24 endopeptidase [Butyrivibrio sp. M55]